MNIYIGNMSFDTTEDQLREAFEGYGAVSSVNIIADRDSGRPRGFAFVEMASQEEGTAAIAGMNGQDLNGRTLNVNEARQREDRGGHGGQGSRGGGGGGRGRNRSW